jgi:hypothetical protein
MSEPVRVEPLEHPNITHVLQALRANGSQEVAAFRAYWRGQPFRVIRTRDPYGRRSDGSPDYRWHLSISQERHPGEVPLWRALVAIAHKIRPGVPFIVGIPPEGQWMNVHPGVLHVVEVHDPNLTSQWQFEAVKGHRPT